VTIDERIVLMAGADTWHTHEVAGVARIRMSDGPAGVRGTDWSGPASASFPCGTALAASFDPELIREVGRALGREARSKNAHVLLGPTVNLHRTPIGGRNFECMSEDPFLTAAMAAAYIEGVQSERVACCVKHFVGNDTEFNRMTISSEISERVLREVYLLPFEAAVAAGVRSIMTGYNRLNGTYCSEHEWLLGDVLRGEWGFDGVVVSDWFGTHSAAASLRAGLDIEMPGPPRHRGEALQRAYAAGEVADAHLDHAVERIRALAEWAGAADTGTGESTDDDPSTYAVIRRAAAAGTVLLKNDPVGDTPLLPLLRNSRIALIGPYAATGRVQGGGSAKVRPHRPSALLPALRERGFPVEHHVGCHIDRFLPAMRGTFEFILTDTDGAAFSYERNRLDLLRQTTVSDGLADEVGARITGTFVPDATGEWQIGLRAVGAATVSLDGNPIVAADGSETGGSFFGYGSHEAIVSVSLTEGVPCRIEVDYPIAPTDSMRGLAVGARLVPHRDLIADAVAAARSADVAVVMVGTNDDWETEAEDRVSMDLPGRQDELVAAVAAANPNTVVVLNAGSPVSMPWLDAVPTVLQIWFPGGQLGAALTDVLSGDVEPSGRLPVTIPHRLEDTPAFDHYPGDGERAVYGEGLLIGHRWYHHHGHEPVFHFGHGLGYTSFDIEPCGLVGDIESGIAVDVDLVNTGSRPGAEVVQVYVRHLDDAQQLRLLRFAGWSKHRLVPGQRRRLTIEVQRRSFESWIDGRWTVPSGPFEVLVGRSSGELVQVGVTKA
jgi:beta-glucosidase